MPCKANKTDTTFVCQHHKDNGLLLHIYVKIIWYIMLIYYIKCIYYTYMYIIYAYILLYKYNTMCKYKYYL